MAIPKVIGLVNKQPAEKFPITADFAPELALDADTISTVVMSARNKATGADTSATILDGGHSVSGTKVIQTVKAGTAGEKHVVTYRVTTTLGRIWEADIQVDVTEV